MAATNRKPQTSSSAATDRATQYAVDVVTGVIIAGPHVRNSCKRHLDDLERGHLRGLRFDEVDAAKAIRFFETKLRLNGGQFEGLPFNLAPSQAFKIGSLFGWKRSDGTRRFRRFYNEEGKGNGKSPLAAGIGLYMMTADGEAGSEIYAAAANKDQAMVLFRDSVKMVRQSPDLAKRLQFSGGMGREYNIAYLATGSFFRPISKEQGSTGSGPRPHCGLCDEVHEHPNRDAMEMLERGFKFRRQPLLAMFTNSGSDRKSVCWEEHEHAVRVAAGNSQAKDDDATFLGEPVDDTTFCFVASLDVGDDPLTDPSCWIKTNPMLGVILQPDYLAGVVAQALAMPGKANGILRLHFCKWTESATAWITRETLEPLLDDFDTDEMGAVVGAGLDLSGTKDLTSAAFVAADGFTDDGKPKFAAWVEAWTPEETLTERSRADRAPYDIWVREGFMHATPGKRVDYSFVAKHLSDVDALHPIEALAYDNYAYDKFRTALDEVGLSVRELSHPQAGRKRAKSDVEGELGLWMPGSLSMLEELILDGRIRFKRNPVLISAMMSAAVESDPLENRWFAKRKATQRIDPLVALTMAIGAATMKEFVPVVPSIMMLD